MKKNTIESAQKFYQSTPVKQKLDEIGFSDDSKIESHFMTLRGNNGGKKVALWLIKNGFNVCYNHEFRGIQMHPLDKTAWPIRNKTTNKKR